MADSLLDIGTDPAIFPLVLNWNTLPVSNLLIGRYINEYRGGVTTINQKTADAPIVFSGDFDLKDKAVEYDFIQFMHSVVGRSGRFWVKYPKQLFNLVEDLGVGSDVIKVEPNQFTLQYQGYERIYIETMTGDVTTRHITNVVFDEFEDVIEMTVATPIDSEINIEDVLIFGRFLLVRFDSDQFPFSLHTDRHSAITQRFVELVKEYAEIT